MSTQHLPSRERRRSQVGALALVALVLLGACTTGAPTTGRLMAQRDQQPGLHQSSETRERTEAAWEGAGDDALLFARLPTDFAPVRVGEAEFKAALSRMVLDMPLRVASSNPGRRGGGLVPGSGGSGEEAWQLELSQSYGRYCEQRGTPGDCFSLLEDGPHLQGEDKRSIAMALAVGPALEGVNAEVRAMLDPTRVLATVSITLTAYMALMAAPDPVLTKGVAATFAVLLWGYLGFELFELIRAYGRLSEDAVRATTFAELREAAERFGRVIGPNSVRILVLVLKRFGAEALHNTENIIPLDKELHTRVSAFYSSIQKELTGSRKLTVRMWLGTQSLEAQRRFGLLTIENIRRGFWK